MAPQSVPYIEINLDNLIHNLNQVKISLSATNGIIGVVKDDAYGCGAAVIAKALHREGVHFFAVALLDEARELRAAKLYDPVLVLGEVCTEDQLWASSENIRMTINSPLSLKQMAGLASPVLLHMQIDTGMNRMGIAVNEIVESLDILYSNKHLILEGVFTHFASSDDPDSKSVMIQQQRFSDALRLIHARGIVPQFIHCSNSAAIIRHPIPADYLVRPGIVLYGCKPDPVQNFAIDLRTVAALKGSVVRLQRVPAETPVSYGGTYITRQPTTIATVPIGYAHGLPRLLSNRGEMLIRGRRFRIAGRVTMDFTMLDLGAATDICIGDEVVAMGYQGDEHISADEIAVHSGTIGYEILCGLNNRIHRYYTSDSIVIAHHHKILL